MSIGVWVVAGVILFVVGNIMALKPRVGEVRVGEMRLFARKIELNPKLVPIPDWLGKSGMVAKYSMIDDSWQLPDRQWAWADDVWQNETGVISGVVPPSFILPYLKGLTTKANSVTLYWRDESYAKSFAIRDEQAMMTIEQDLMMLKEFLLNVGDDF